MTSIMTAVVDHVAPWRASNWLVIVLGGALLAIGGFYFLIDGERAEFVLGAIISAVLLLDGLRLWYTAFRTTSRGRARDVVLIRGGVGVIFGGLVLAFSATGQMSVVAIRAALGLAVLIFGLLGLWIASPARRNAEGSWTVAAFDGLLIALGLLLLYRVATSDSIALLLGAIGWLTILAGLGFVALGLYRRFGSRAAEEE